MKGALSMLQPGQEITAKEEKHDFEVEKPRGRPWRRPCAARVKGWTPLIAPLGWVLAASIWLTSPALGEANSSSPIRSLSKGTNQGPVIGGQVPPDASTGPGTEPKGFVMVIDPLG